MTQGVDVVSVRCRAKCAACADHPGVNNDDGGVCGFCRGTLLVDADVSLASIVAILRAAGVLQ